ncbi:MAG: sodium/proton antiporter, NhaD family [Bacteroidetes bacterium]|nr:MAG: sodium/proton antiporter, NhaD family [Bacteroidota bacterium]
MTVLILVVFALGYFAIAFEHPLKVNKSASALITGVLCWTIYILFQETEAGKISVDAQLDHHISGIAAILFFLLGAMTIVELIDSHDGFDVITRRIKTTDKRKLALIVSFTAFFLSAVLDNLTTAIVMVALVSKLIGDRNDRLLFCGLVIIAANAGGAWSPIGDVTTTMLWIAERITTANIILKLILPSLVCMLVPLLFILPRLKGANVRPKEEEPENDKKTSARERNIVFFSGMTIMLLVPVFKTVTHLEPYMGMLLGVGILWVITEIVHKKKNDEEKHALSVAHALRRIDTPSVLFFFGILAAVSVLESAGILGRFSLWMDDTIGNIDVITISTGLASAVVDNVPLMAAAIGMYPLEQFATDHYFWEFMAYCAGTGGSILIIGSAAGVAVMGIEKISFLWYLKKISLPALAGYLAGAFVYMAIA